MSRLKSEDQTSSSFFSSSSTEGLVVVAAAMLLLTAPLSSQHAPSCAQVLASSPECAGDAVCVLMLVISPRRRPVGVSGTRRLDWGTGQTECEFFLQGKQGKQRSTQHTAHSTQDSLSHSEICFLPASGCLRACRPACCLSRARIWDRIHRARTSSPRWVCSRVL